MLLDAVKKSANLFFGSLGIAVVLCDKLRPTATGAG